MGQYWLQDLDEILRPGVGKGIKELVLIDGWETRSRSTGGLESINGLLDHHTASPESWNWDRDIEYITYTNPYAPSPVSQLYQDRTGRVAIIAAGAANHGGKGGAYPTSGTPYVGVNQANTHLIGKEMGNNGIGEPWPYEQIEASIVVDALICLAEKWGPGRVFAHKEYCGPGTSTPGRKIDPFGPWENHPSELWLPNSTWGDRQGTIDYYRHLVSIKMVELSKEINIMHGFVSRPDTIKPRILDTRGANDAYKLNAGVAATVAVPGGAGKAFAVVNLVAVHPESNGYLTAWAGGSMPVESKLNYAYNQTVANEVTIPLAEDGSFKLWSNNRTHVVIDLVGYYQKV